MNGSRSHFVSLLFDLTFLFFLLLIVNLRHASGFQICSWSRTLASPSFTRAKTTTICYRPSSPSQVVMYGEGDGGPDISQALNFLRSGARILQELGSHEVDETEAELELRLQEEEQEKKRQAKQEEKKKKEEQKEQKEQQQTKQQSAKDGVQHTLNASLSNNQSHVDIQEGATQEQKEAYSLQLTGVVKKNATKSNETSSKGTNNTTNSNGNSTELAKQMQALLEARLDAFERKAMRTRIVLLKKIASWAFDVCATTEATTSETSKKKAPRIDRHAFYSGILLVHLHLAKYVGVAACHPPTREQIDELFVLADHDRSGHLDEQEFTNAVVVACAPIASRIAVYWTLLALLPLLTTGTMGGFGYLVRAYVHRLPVSIYQKMLAVLEWSVEHVFSLFFFSIVVPTIFARIDKTMRRRARERSKQRKASTSLWWLQLPQPRQPTSNNSSNDKDSKDMSRAQPAWMVDFGDWVNKGLTNPWSRHNIPNQEDPVEETNSNKRKWNWGHMFGRG